MKLHYHNKPIRKLVKYSPYAQKYISFLNSKLWHTLGSPLRDLRDVIENELNR